MSLLLLFNQGAGSTITGALAATEASDILEFVSSQVSGVLAAFESPDIAAFLLKVPTHWTPAIKQSETWTPS